MVLLGLSSKGPVLLCKTPRMGTGVLGKRSKGHICRGLAAELQLPIVALFLFNSKDTQLDFLRFLRLDGLHA